MITGHSLSEPASPLLQADIDFSKKKKKSKGPAC